MSQEISINRRSKDSVFVDFFKDKNNVLQLYKELHPEDTDVTSDDIDIQTIKSVLVNTLYNDLGFIVKDKFVMLVEAQSVWNPNMPLRMLFYISETYRRYISDTQQSEHSSSLVKLPKPEFYVVYSGDKAAPEEVSFGETFFGGGSPLDLKIKILSEANETVHGQYIGFCKVFNEQTKLNEDKIACIKEIIRICIEKGYLAEYFKQHEKEAIDMMSELFDEVYLRKAYDISRERELIEQGEAKGKAEGLAEGEAKGKAEGLAEGEAKGKAEGLAEGEAKGKRKIASALLKLGTLSKEEISATTGLTLEELSELSDE